MDRQLIRQQALAPTRMQVAPNERLLWIVSSVLSQAERAPAHETTFILRTIRSTIDELGDCVGQFSGESLRTEPSRLLVGFDSAEKAIKYARAAHLNYVGKIPRTNVINLLHHTRMLGGRLSETTVVNHLRKLSVQVAENRVVVTGDAFDALNPTLQSLCTDYEPNRSNRMYKLWSIAVDYSGLDDTAIFNQRKLSKSVTDINAANDLAAASINVVSKKPAPMVSIAPAIATEPALQQIAPTPSVTNVAKAGMAVEFSAQEQNFQLGLAEGKPVLRPDFYFQSGSNVAERMVFSNTRHRLAIGREKLSDLSIPHERISRRHATLELHGEDVLFIDHSSNGSLIIGSDDGHEHFVCGRSHWLSGCGVIHLGADQSNTDKELQLHFHCDKQSARNTLNS